MNSIESQNPQDTIAEIAARLKKLILSLSVDDALVVELFTMHVTTEFIALRKKQQEKMDHHYRKYREQEIDLLKDITLKEREKQELVNQCKKIREQTIDLQKQIASIDEQCRMLLPAVCTHQKIIHRPGLRAKSALVSVKTQRNSP
jgi:hypothetical protein